MRLCAFKIMLESIMCTNYWYIYMHTYNYIMHSSSQLWPLVGNDTDYTTLASSNSCATSQHKNSL